MPTFTYVARDRHGNESEGSLVAASSAEVREQLRNRELFMTSCKTGALSDVYAGPGLFKRKIKLNDLVVMSRQLATLVRSGLTIIEALSTVGEQSENPSLTAVFERLREDVLGGLSLADAMRRHPKVFSEVYVNLVEAGETGGTLDQTLEVAADQLNAEAELREQVKSAMAYPILVVVASIGTVIFMLAVIVPVFANVYEQFKSELPITTRSLVFLSKWLFKTWWIMLLAVVFGVIAFRRYSETDKGQYRVDALKLRLPLVGKLLKKISVARFTQTWAGVTKGGVPILQAMTVSAKTCGNVILRDAIYEARERVKEGSVLADPLHQSGEFPPMVTRMIAAGEKSGNLDEMLSEITKFYKRDIEHTVQRLTRLLEPLMTVIVGGIVLFVLLALYMPIFNLGNVVKR